jgi:hypothetical protein
MALPPKGKLNHSLAYPLKHHNPTLERRHPNTSRNTLYNHLSNDNLFWALWYNTPTNPFAFACTTDLARLGRGMREGWFWTRKTNTLFERRILYIINVIIAFYSRTGEEDF